MIEYRPSPLRFPYAVGSEYAEALRARFGTDRPTPAERERCIRENLTLEITRDSSGQVSRRFVPYGAPVVTRAAPTYYATAVLADRADDPWFHQKRGEGLAQFAERLALAQPNAGLLARELGYAVGEMNPHYANGTCSGVVHHPSRQIGLDIYRDADAQYRTLCHEVAHCLGFDAEGDCDRFADAFLQAARRVWAGELRREVR